MAMVAQRGGQASEVWVRASSTAATEVSNVAEKTTSSSLSDAVRAETVREHLSAYAALSKVRLSALVVLTSAAGYAMAPAALCTLPHGAALVATAVGTGLCAGSANTFNQAIEVKHDAKMNRTKTRVLPTGKLGRGHATGFAVATGAAGVGLLGLAANPLTAALGAANIALYAGIYTPLKRVHAVNTWVGAVVGAIPPVMGYAACMGTIDTTALYLGATLFSWQMPHFMALAYNLKDDYLRGGYKMMPSFQPKRAAAVSLRHAGVMAALAGAAPLMAITTPAFALTAGPVNAYLGYKAYQFWKHPTHPNARSLFRVTLWQLPVVLALMLLFKNHGVDDGSESQQPFHAL